MTCYVFLVKSDMWDILCFPHGRNRYISWRGTPCHSYTVGCYLSRWTSLISEWNKEFDAKIPGWHTGTCIVLWWYVLQNYTVTLLKVNKDTLLLIPGYHNIFIYMYNVIHHRYHRLIMIELLDSRNISMLDITFTRVQKWISCGSSPLLCKWEKNGSGGLQLHFYQLYCIRLILNARLGILPQP